MKADVARMPRRQEILACSLGVSLAIGLLFSFYIPLLLLPHPTVASAETGIPDEKLILLDYFIFMPWHVTNLMQVDYFYEVDYDDSVDEGSLLFTIVHSSFFLVGALLAMILSRDQRSTDVTIRKKAFLRPWVLYTLLMLGAHLALMGAAATYYTGPGGPAWVYPSPLFLILFALLIGVLSYVAHVIYSSLLREGFYFKSLIVTLSTYIAVTGLAVIIQIWTRHDFYWIMLWTTIFLYIYLICAFVVALYKYLIAPMRIEVNKEKDRPKGLAIIAALDFIAGFITLLFGIATITGGTAGTFNLSSFVLRSTPGVPFFVLSVGWGGGVVGYVIALIILAIIFLLVSWRLWNGNNWARVLAGTLFSLGVLGNIWTLIQVMTILRGAIIRLSIELLSVYYLTRPHVAIYFK